MKLIAPRIEEILARCGEKIARSTEAPAWARLAASGGYTVQPVPTPASTVEDASRRGILGVLELNIEIVRLCFTPVL